jgi:hypothetical protein
MLKNLTGFVLASNQSSTYPRRYASGLFSSAASPDELFEHLQIILYSRSLRREL